VFAQLPGLNPSPPHTPAITRSSRPLRSNGSTGI
jgi:hypothetical protein